MIRRSCDCVEDILLLSVELGMHVGVRDDRGLLLVTTAVIEAL